MIFNINKLLLLVYNYTRKSPFHNKEHVKRNWFEISF